MTVRIVLADDHRVLRDALAEVLAKEADFQVVGEAGTGEETLAEVQRTSPDVLVLDIAMPDVNGIEVARRLREAGGKATKVLILSTYADRRYVQEAVKAGAMGYVAKSAAGEELAQAVRTVAEGREYFSSEAASALAARWRAPDPGGPPPVSVLGRREREVLARLAEGARSADIAREFGITVATVEVHRRNIMRKLDLHNVAELTKYALREGLISL